MARTRTKKAGCIRLPPYVRELFWEYGLRDISWSRHRRFVIKRVLSHGETNALKWLRKNTTSEELRKWFMETRGRALDPPRLRYWELMLGLPKKDVDRWIREMKKNPWHRRTGA
jgi:hypothetical protein